MLDFGDLLDSRDSRLETEPHRRTGRAAWRLVAPANRRRATVVVSLVAALAATAVVFLARRTRSAEMGHREKPPVTQRFAQTFDATHFQRGNIHAHSRLSDGDSKPDAVIAWYRRHGYQFAALTDHNVFFDPKRYANLTAPGFTLIPGEEITMTGHGGQQELNQNRKLFQE